MLRKSMTCWLLLALAACPAAARAQSEAVPPTVVLRVKSFETLIRDVKVLAKAVDKEEVGNQIEQLIKAQTGAGGLQGIDTKRPWAFYSKVGEDLSNVGAVAMIPVSDEKAFLALLENVNFPAKKDQKGRYIVDQALVPVQVGFRLANKYAYITAENFEVLEEANLLAPAQVFPKGSAADISGAFRVDQIPKEVKRFGIQEMRDNLAREKAKELPGEGEAEKQFRAQVLDYIGDQIEAFLEGGREIAVDVAIDPKTEKATFELSLDGQKGSELAGSIAALGQSKSLFADLADPKAAFSAVLNVEMPEALRKGIDPFISQGIKNAIDEEKDPKKRRQLEVFLKALEPTLRSGQGDVGVVLRSHLGGKATLLMGMKVQDGGKLESAVKEIVRDLPAGDREKIKLDADKIGAVNVHRIDVQEFYDADARRVFGQSPVYFALTDDALLVALGQEAMPALKTAAALRPGTGPAGRLHIAVGQLAPVVAKTDAEKQAARQVFSDDNPGRLEFTVEGGPKFRVRYEFDLSILKYATQLDASRREVLAPPAAR